LVAVQAPSVKPGSSSILQIFICYGQNTSRFDKGCEDG